MRMIFILNGRFRLRAHLPIGLTFAYETNHTTFLAFSQFTQFLLRKLPKQQA